MKGAGFGIRDSGFARAGAPRVLLRSLFPRIHVKASDAHGSVLFRIPNPESRIPEFQP
jgi:hypothetical protein